MEQQEQLVIYDAKVASILLQDMELDIFKTFCKGEQSIKDVSDSLGLAMQNVYYHVRKWLKYGLLMTSRKEKRSKRTVKLYHLAAKQFIIPYRVTKASTSREFFDLLTGDFQDQFSTAFIPPNIQDEIGVMIDQEGKFLRKSFVFYSQQKWQEGLNFGGPRKPNEVQYARIHLETHKAEMIIQKIEQLLAEAATTPEKGERYLFFLGLAHVGKKPETLS